ncbi:MAG TPA: hypothetical protein VFP65_10560 [Anaeromyxobacteraceae bacterium]|nr:hypothetical protein [Anaeromyxobacteraceae bacterium]
MLRILARLAGALERRVLGVSAEEIRYTFEDVRNELRATRAELKAEIAALRADVERLQETASATSTDSLPRTRVGGTGGSGAEPPT